MTVKTRHHSLAAEVTIATAEARELSVRIFELTEHKYFSLLLSH